ncbi:MAG TPA: patatin-like protein [Bryobacteraceae bacterium]|jgi:predicted acylesterase/phospholipase RssA
MRTNMEEEVRFALVLYGGVSLAVYMNGVTQEFLNLVRGNGVYKELAAITQSRFVVDIASGSSAGGINAIFLGKALANGQSLDRLNRLWLDEASLSRLWNKDRFPRSLLSGREMYSMLFDAFEDMDRSSGSGPLQSEMDVFITATDIQGLELPMQLADTSVVEKNHKNVFHMEFNTEGKNDFSRAMNPFLAFASRATSSFPAAFEPMRLVDSNEAPDAKRFFPAYVAANADYSRRAFGDGGYLNNKPFSYALREIPRRASDLPVRRLLMYIEPSPEQACGNSTAPAPGAIRNSIEALITLHQYETIRQDLRDALERNRLIGRVREITNLVAQDVETWQRAGNSEVPRLTGPEYASRTLADEIHARGPSYASYHRLKVRAVTDELGSMIGNVTSIEEWRKQTYSEQEENSFLLHFDLAYRQRRLRFLLAKLDEAGGAPELRSELNRLSQDLSHLDCRMQKIDFASMQIDSATALVRRAFEEVMIPAAERIEHCLAGHPLKAFFDRYEDYDQVTFPIFYETDVGETEPVEIFRISPLDAKSIVDETSPAEPRRKLAGTVLFHFGAFLKREWRENDVLWGRLDGAERIISAVLPPGSPDGARLLREAHLDVLRERFGAQAETAYQDLKTNYEVDRKIGVITSLKLLARLAAVSFRMSIATGLVPVAKRFLSTLKLWVPPVAR